MSQDPPATSGSVGAGSVILSLLIMVIFLGGIGLIIFLYFDKIKDYFCGIVDKDITKILLKCPKSGGTIGGGGFGIGKDTCATNEDGSTTGNFSINGLSGCYKCPDDYEQNRKWTSIKCRDIDSPDPQCKSLTLGCKKSIFTSSTKVEDFKLLDIDNLKCPDLEDGRKTFKRIGGKECMKCPVGYHPRPGVAVGNSKKCEKDSHVPAIEKESKVNCGPGQFHIIRDGPLKCWKCPGDTSHDVVNGNCVHRTAALSLSEDEISGGCKETNPEIDSDRLYKVGIKGCNVCPVGFVPTPAPPRSLALIPKPSAQLINTMGIAIRRGPVACVKQEDREGLNISSCLKEVRPGGETLIECIQGFDRVRSAILA